MTKKRIILVGKSASGKDHARKILEKNFYKYGISYTTRPPRSNEVNGKDYHFISKEKFLEMEKENCWYEFVEFNDWFYGTTKEQFYGQCNVFIMTPIGLSHLSQKDRDDSLVIYFNIDEATRKNRMQQRSGNADSIERRLKADFNDFKNFTNFDVEINKENYNEEDLLKIIQYVQKN